MLSHYVILSVWILFARLTETLARLIAMKENMIHSFWHFCTWPASLLRSLETLYFHLLCNIVSALIGNLPCSRLLLVFTSYFLNPLEFLIETHLMTCNLSCRLDTYIDHLYLI